MKDNVKSIVEQIDTLLSFYGTKEKSFHDNQGRVNRQLIITVSTRLIDGITRLSPINSTAIKSAQSFIEGSNDISDHWIPGQLAAILEALRADYAEGYISTIQELIHADLFSDFLEMAEHLLKEGFKDPAAVLAGSTLEEHLRKLCAKSGIDTVKHTEKGDIQHSVARLNDDLKKADIYNNLEKTNVTAWYALRNKAAHGKYEEYDHKQVAGMIQGIRDFMMRNSA